MSKDRIIDVLVFVLIGIGSLVLVERLFFEPRDMTTAATKITETFALPIGIGIRVIKWLNDEKLELLRRVDATQVLAASNREGYQGLNERVDVAREEISELSEQLREAVNVSDKRLVRLETTTSLVRKLDSLELRMNELDIKFNGFLIKEESEEHD